MAAFIDERNHILSLVEAGQVSAAEAAQLLDALGAEQTESRERPVQIQNRTLRIWMTETPNTPKIHNTPGLNNATGASSRRQKVKVTATLPTALIGASLRLLSHLSPQLNEQTLREALRAIEQGATGRVLDVYDLEEGKRLEIFVER
jgi:hypothetical protein